MVIPMDTGLCSAAAHVLRGGKGLSACRMETPKTHHTQKKTEHQGQSRVLREPLTMHPMWQAEVAIHPLA